MSQQQVSPPPSLPYDVVELPFGPGAGILRPCKKYSHGPGDILSEDEARVWLYLKWVEGERDGLRAEVERMKAGTVTTAVPVEKPAVMMGARPVVGKDGKVPRV